MKIDINKDIRDYKVKDIGPFTIKEFISVLIAVILGYSVFALMKKMGWEISVTSGNDLMFLPMILAAAIPLIFGFYKPHGISMWTYIKTLFNENIVSPKVRTYGCDFDYSKLEVLEKPDETDNLTAPAKYSKEEQAEIKKWKGYK